MFPPEVEEGNVEYKRHLCSKDLKSFDKHYNIRFQQLITQLKYRLNEGNGLAIYYIGIEDDGTVYKLTKDERTFSLMVIKKMVLFLEASITSVIFNKDYIKITIKDKWKSNILPEKRVLLLGDTECGKTTFLAYLIKNKLDTDVCKARLFILNHKHELESGKTSSFNYQYKNFKGTKYVFIDTPGDDILFSKSSKIRNKILLSFKFDLIIFMNKKNKIWSKKDLYISYATFLKIPYIDLNLFEESSIINLVEPISQNDILSIMEKKIDDNNIIVKKQCHSMVNFYLLQSYPHIDLGWILSGFLSTGKLEVGQELLWYDYDKIPVKINTIYRNNSPVKEIVGPATITITLQDTRNINNKPRFGFLSNINYLETKFVKIIWIYFNSSEVLEEIDINISVKNQFIKLRKIDNKPKYKLISPILCYNLINQYFIFEKDNLIAFGKLTKII